MSVISLLDYHSHDQIDNNFWRELGTTIDKIDELRVKGDINLKLNLLLSRLPVSALKELSSFYGVPFSEDLVKDDFVKLFFNIDKEDKIEILTLQDFLNRKKRSINEVYSIKNTEVLLKSSLARVKSMYDNSPKLLMEALTYYIWSEKGTGNLFSINKKLSYQNILKIINEYKKAFPEKLYKLNNMKNNYRIHSYYLSDGKELIVSLYKQINDSPKADFDGAIRNKEVTNILLAINTEKQIIEIKNANKSDETNIKNYLEETFQIKISEIESEVFDKYEASEVKEAFLTGKSAAEEVEAELLTTKITFRTSLLKRTPRVTLELDNESIWPSVEDAYGKGSISLKSIKDIESISVKMQNKKRLIRSVLLPNGNVIFSLDDSRMDKITRDKFSKSFLEQFGIPLFQEISNLEFFEGKADKVDYLMSISKKSSVAEIEKALLEELISNSLMTEKKKLVLTCRACKDVTELDDIDYDIREFQCSCEHAECYSQTFTTLEVDMDNAKKYVKNKLEQFVIDLGYIYSPKPSTYDIDSEKFEFVNMNNSKTNETLQFFITADHIRPAFLKRLSTMMVPTIIITIGMVDEAVQSLRDKGVYVVNFGNIYFSKDEELKPVFYDNIEKIRLQLKSNIAKAADHAYCSLQRLLCEPTEIDSKYTDKVFEDDVFAIIKDMVPNGIKWGKEKSGKVFPEGIFAISTKKVNEQVLTRVFSFDCKFTRLKKGYDLKKEEQRKAIDYVERLNDNDYVVKFSDKSELTAHIFISNRFRDSQIKGMKSFFNEKLGEDYNTRPIFIDVSSFLYLHECYRKNIEELNKHRNRFYEQLIWLFTRENITNEEVTKMFERVLDKDLEEHKTLDTNKVTDLLEGA
ncbi:hypothetical protein [Bacillus mycoides]|uniref:hypothetical protein n=1 Tax=Bacillus mycoides TaxID=1405 RepID=UPI001A9920C6|nr:hypothetical protein [Bacillus mycoides]